MLHCGIVPDMHVHIHLLVCYKVDHNQLHYYFAPFQHNRCRDKAWRICVDRKTCPFYMVFRTITLLDRKEHFCAAKGKHFFSNIPNSNVCTVCDFLLPRVFRNTTSPSIQYMEDNLVHYGNYAEQDDYIGADGDMELHKEVVSFRKQLEDKSLVLRTRNTTRQRKRSDSFGNSPCDKVLRTFNSRQLITKCCKVFTA